jgi:hypothetical protein
MKCKKGLVFGVVLLSLSACGKTIEHTNTVEVPGEQEECSVAQEQNGDATIRCGDEVIVVSADRDGKTCARKKKHDRD